ncbi:MAG: serine protease [Bacteroidetes bacterium]|nr:serine protease [Bacteroidota bacterium]MBU1115994.1 serine protease [Bacteroidota bacterium]MBU1799238.1 serine protease [Bacteroidota bacterium]
MKKDRIDFYKEIEKSRNSKLIIYITGDRPGLETQIHPEILEYFVDHLDSLGNNKVEKISLFLYTRGGSTLAAWSLVNLLRQFCKELEVIIPSKAQSAGTLIAIGADKVVMTKQAILGPIDPSVNGPLNPQNPAFPNNLQARLPVSVESINAYFQLASEDVKVNKSSDLVNVFTNLANQVHPLVLGDVYRTRTQIQMLARKLLNRTIKNSKEVERIISFLTSGSGSHDYTIYRSEAKDELGLKIEKPNDTLYKVIKKIYDDISEELELRKRYDPNMIIGTNSTAPYEFRRTLIESLHGGTDVLISKGILTKRIQTIQQPPPFPPIDRTVVEDNRTFEGWQHEV